MDTGADAMPVPDRLRLRWPSPEAASGVEDPSVSEADVGLVGRVAGGDAAALAALQGCPPLVDLVDRYAKAEGRYLVCPICFDARKLDKSQLIEPAELGGTVPMWQWIGDDGATTFGY